MRSIGVDDRARQGWGATSALEPRFAPMVDRLERSAAANPRSHGYRVLAAGLLGYGVLAATLLVSLALAIGIVVFLIAHPGAAVGGIKLLIPIGGIALSLILALRVRWPAPDGIAVTAQDTPALHALIGSIRSTTRGPRIHEVRITDAMNAAISQYPRPMPLPARNVLFLGLPLLQVMAPREVEAVIAHEMGHFVGRHGRTASFVYHIRTRWTQLGERLPGGFVAGGLRRFFGWYGPWFAAYSFVLARRQEYEADACAARIVGAATAGDALVRIACQSARWHQGWSLIWSQSAERPDPPNSPYRTLGAFVIDEADEPHDAAADTLAHALARRSDLDDTHPSLAQRLAALGVEPVLPSPVVVAAADVLLGEALPSIVDRLDAEWHAAADGIWADDYRARQDLRAERTDLEARAADGILDEAAQHRLAQLIEVIDGPVRGAAAFADVVARFPQAHGSRFRHGDALLDAGDAAGIDALLAAAQGEPALRLAALDRIVRYACAEGRADLIATFEPQLDAAIAADEAARRLSATIDESVTLRALDPEQRDALVRIVAEIDGVKWLHAGVRDLAAGPQIVFVFATQRHYTGREVLDALIAAVDGDLLGIEHSRPRNWLTHRLKRLPGSGIRG